MKRMLGVILVVAIFSIILLGGMGCDLLGDIDCEPSGFITVVVDASIHATVTAGGDPVLPWSGAWLAVEINKAGGERVIFDRTTDSAGNTDRCPATFEVYKEQYVEIIVDAVSGVYPAYFGNHAFDTQDSHTTGERSYIALGWEQISKDTKMGGTYWWYPDVTLAISTYIQE